MQRGDKQASKPALCARIPKPPLSYKRDAANYTYPALLSIGVSDGMAGSSVACEPAAVIDVEAP